MGRGHRLGDKTNKRSLKVIPGFECEIREQLLCAYRSSEADSAERLSNFKALDAHERKHGCGPRFKSHAQQRRD